MNKTTIDLVHELTLASDEERISFPDVIGRLMAGGVERYHADLVRFEKTYYLPSGDSQIEPCHHAHGTPAAAFSGPGVEAAVRASQRGEIKYQEFCRRALDAGCVGYVVSIPGRRVVYYGRTGETHVEHFPGAK
jgi:uncharacterized protein YbcV (DUF1398 family)